MKKVRNSVPKVKFYKHKSEERYLRIEGTKTSQYIFEKRGNTTTQKIIQNVIVPPLELRLKYEEVGIGTFNNALYNGHSHLYQFENGHNMTVQQRSLKTA